MNAFLPIIIFSHIFSGEYNNNLCHGHIFIFVISIHFETIQSHKV